MPFARQNNLDNLGSLMQDVSLDVTGWEEAEDSIKTKWRFRCVLGLPWKPTLAAAGVSGAQPECILFSKLCFGLDPGGAPKCQEKTTHTLTRLRLFKSRAGVVEPSRTPCTSRASRRTGLPPLAVVEENSFILVHRASLLLR